MSLSDKELNNLPPDKRALAIADYLKERNLYHAPPAQIITQEAIIARHAMGIWDQVIRNVAKPLLKSVKTPRAYSKAGTQRILMDAFKSRFNSMSKDDLVILVSQMHTEELEKQCESVANAGMIGEDMDKPI